jgi:hypothetical protein
MIEEPFFLKNAKPLIPGSALMYDRSEPGINPAGELIWR